MAEESSALRWLLPAVIAAGVSGAVAYIPYLRPSAQAKLEHTRQVVTFEKELILLYKGTDVITGPLLLEYTLKPLIDDQATFDKFSADLETLRTSFGVEGKNTTADAKEFNAALSEVTAPAAPIPTAQEITEKFDSPDRLKFSDELIAKFGTDAETLAKALVGALVTSGSKEYRVNLYIALTLARIPGGWPKTADPQGQVDGLLQDFTGNATFQKRVKEAIDNRTT